MIFEQQLYDYFFGDIEKTQDRLKRIQLRFAKEKLVKEIKKYDFSNVSLDKSDSNCVYGITHQGSSFSWYINSGYHERSRSCGRLVVDGECIFTSGTFIKAIPYIAKLIPHNNPNS